MRPSTNYKENHPRKRMMILNTYIYMHNKRDRHGRVGHVMNWPVINTMRWRE